MKLFVLLVTSGAFLGVFRRTLDGVLWAGALFLFVVVLARLFPDTQLAAAVHSIVPFSVHL